MWTKQDPVGVDVVVDLEDHLVLGQGEVEALGEEHGIDVHIAGASVQQPVDTPLQQRVLDELWVVALFTSTPFGAGAADVPRCMSW